MDCGKIRTRLDAYRTEELPDAAYRMTQDHLAGCEACRIELAAIADLAETALRLRKKAPASIQAVSEVDLDHYGVAETEFGPAYIAYTTGGISAVKIGVEDDESFERFYQNRLGRLSVKGRAPAKYVKAVQKALRGEKPARPPIALEGLPEFERTVLHHLAGVPYGEVRPYAWLAREAGKPGAVRAVGTIMARNPVPFLLPCHRIVPSGGGVGNYGYGPDMKRTLLEREGVSTSELEGWKKQRVKYIGSRTTGIYCYPTCRDARRISWENRVSFSSESAAAENGYRPCKHCRPMERMKAEA